MTTTLFCPIPFNEERRLIRLSDLKIDFIPHDHFSDLTERVQSWFGTSAAMVSFVAEDRLVIKSTHGIDVKSAPRQVSFCTHAIMGENVFVVADTTVNPVFKDHPAVVQEPYVRFYAGAPIKTDDGYRLGTICAFDSAPRTELDHKDRMFLKTMAELCFDRLKAFREKHLGEIRHNETAIFDSKRDFLRMISHEFKTPLNAISGFSDIMIMMNGALDEQKLNDYARNIKTGAEQLANLLEKVLVFSDINNGDIQRNDQRCAVDDIIDRTICLATAQAVQHDIELKPSTPMAGAVMNADSDLIIQAINNLTLNAVVAAPAGTSVTVGFEIDRQTAMPTFFVEDEGGGLPDYVRHRLGEPFLRGALSETTQAPGLGLGLPVAARLAAMHGGAIVPSAPGSSPHRMSLVLPRYVLVPQQR